MQPLAAFMPEHWASFWHWTHWLLTHICPPEQPGGHVPSQPLSPHSLLSHCGVHWHWPLAHVPGLPAAAEHVMPLIWFCAAQ
jgi:hypothetical protein